MIQADRRTAIDLVREAHASGARKSKACELLQVSLRTLERWQAEASIDRRKGAKRVIANKLTTDERQMILGIANSAEYCDLPPCQIIPALADKGIYVASESSFYRVLREEKQLARRGRINPPRHKKPTPCQATRPNQLWSWDITFLPSQVIGQYYYLYFVMDVFSRKVVGWSIHPSQCAEHAANLIKQSCIDEKVDRDQLTLHSDNGSPMKGMTMLAMLESLGVVPSFSRPSVSDDNPYSESLFKTLKYHASYPATEKFATIFDARTWCVKFVDWYNRVHKHSGLKFITPEQRHTGQDKQIMRQRKAVYQQAKAARPDRWSRHVRNWELPTTVTLNPNKKTGNANVQQPEQLQALN